MNSTGLSHVPACAVKTEFAAPLLKEIVSRDFEVCLLVPLDSSDIATPAGTGLFFKKNVDFVSNFRFFGPWR
jgi:hypothetical protein